MIALGILFHVLVVDGTCALPEASLGPQCDPDLRHAPSSQCQNARIVWRMLDFFPIDAPCPVSSFHTSFYYPNPQFTSGYFLGTEGTTNGPGYTCDEGTTGYKYLDFDHLYCGQPSSDIYIQLACQRLYAAEKNARAKFDSCTNMSAPWYDLTGYNCHDYITSVMNGDSNSPGYYRFCDDGTHWCGSSGYTCCFNYSGSEANLCYSGAQLICCPGGQEICPVNTVCCLDDKRGCCAAGSVCCPQGYCCPGGYTCVGNNLCSLNEVDKNDMVIGVNRSYFEGKDKGINNVQKV